MIDGDEGILTRFCCYSAETKALVNPRYGGSLSTRRCIHSTRTKNNVRVCLHQVVFNSVQLSMSACLQPSC